MQHVHDQTSSDVRSTTRRRLILPRVLSFHEEATVRCAKARPGSDSSAGSKAPVRLKTSGPHVLAEHSYIDPVFIRCRAAEATCRTHPIWKVGVRSIPRLRNLISEM